MALPVPVSNDQNFPQGAIPMRLVTADGSAFYNAAGSAGQAAQPLGTAAWATGQVATGTSAVVVLAARTGVSGIGRAAGTIMNVTGGTMYLGPTIGVTPSNGFPVPVGATYTVNTQAAVYAVLASGVGTAAFAETY